ncbi:MAG: hypothetical protein HON98_02160 [Chloroflexi bacterium]|jgi:hypothetical protein|nr:hypothetical protein [Chloroflexota bacterium]MBT3668922.1 hypothetical protein [Chloroflexota bacterium]MBT4001879.1 hypothetical protein [Chloroflexota bacterium]MBT4305351.1 hypothetical protein [Chloroflexota bacterium]MBT4532497.1 hypothetical protein [Chloroflexota bacterium]
MEKWMQDSLKGFVGGFLVLPIFSILNSDNTPIQYLLLVGLLSGLIGIIPGIIFGKNSKKSWPAYLGGAIIPLLLIILTLLMIIDMNI